MRKREEINLKKKKGIKNPEKNPCRESREWRSQTKNKKRKEKFRGSRIQSHVWKESFNMSR